MIKEQTTALKRLEQKYNSGSGIDAHIREIIVKLQAGEYVYIHDAVEDMENVKSIFQLEITSVRAHILSRGTEKSVSSLERSIKHINQAIDDFKSIEEIQFAHCGNCGNFIDYEAHVACTTCGSTARCIEPH